MKIPKVRHRELGVKLVNETLKKSRRRGGKDDVVDVQEQVSKPVALIVHKEGDIRCRGSEAELTYERSEPLYHARGACFNP